MANPIQLAVIGGAECDENTSRLAREAGEAIARSGAVLLCGGRGGVMEAAAEGASNLGGLTVGILPGTDRVSSDPNPYMKLHIHTGMGQARNLVLVLSADAVIGIDGSWGTLSEIAHAIRNRIPVVLLDSWDLTRPDGRPEPLLRHAGSPEEAVAMALQAAKERGAE
jgi:hypothetical protein